MGSAENLKKEDSSRIEKEKLILVEGKDELNFFSYLLNKLNLDDIQILNFEGKDNFKNFFNTIQKLSNFNNVKSILVIRDAEKNYSNALKSLRNAFINNGFNKNCVPETIYIYAGNNPKLGFIIMPGILKENNDYLSGTLEDLLYKTLEKNNLEHFNCIDDFFRCLSTKCKYTFKKQHKNYLHVYLSSTNEYVGSKIGEAAKWGAWDLEHKLFTPIKTMLYNL